MSADDFVAATTPRAPDEQGRRPFDVHESWLQGKGAFGGITVATFARVMEELVGDPRRPLRSLTVHFSGPLVPGAAHVDLQEERAGASITHLSGRVRQGDKVTAVGVATFGLPRTTVVPLFDENPLPADIPAAHDLPEVAPPPVFAQHYEYRFVPWALPGSGAEIARVGGWIRPRLPTSLDAPLVCALLDTFPPAAIARSPTFIHATSVNLTVQLVASLPTDVPADARYFIEATSSLATDGYADQRARLWTADGRFLGSVHQLVALLG